MHTKIVIVIIAVLAGSLAAQSPRPFEPPKVRGAQGAETPLAVTNDPAKLYGTPHEAAAAALQAALQASSKRYSNDQIISLLLVAAKREPNYSKAILNLAIMCARAERWEDAINFYNEALRIDPSPDTAKVAKAELERVQTLATLESTPQGKLRRQFDSAFLAVLNMKDDPSVVLAAVKNRPLKIDGTRWERLAYEGVLQAKLGHYPESAEALNNASRLAPAERRKTLVAAAEVLRNEATYQDRVRSAEQAWEKKDYATAGKIYTDAWETAPDRGSAGLQGAVAFLMADQVSPAALTLSRIRQIGSQELADKATAMLKELEPVSPDAAKALKTPRAGPVKQPISDLGEYVAKTVGDLTTPKMLLANKPGPALLTDTTRVTAIPDDELKAPGAFLSTEKIFAIYQRNLPPGAAPASAPEQPAPVAGNPTETAAPAAPGPPAEISGRPPRLTARAEAMAPAAVPPTPVPVEPKPVMPAMTGHGVMITTQPADAVIVFDDNTSATCRTPCQIALAPGRHTMKITRTGYRDMPRIFNVEKNGSAAVPEIVLEEKIGILYVITPVAGARIYVDGQLTTQVTPANVKLREGQHEVGVEVGGTMQKETVAIKDHDMKKLEFGGGGS